MIESTLGPYRSKEGMPYNHVCLTYPYGRYQIPEDCETMRRVHELIRRCAENDVDFGLCECHDDDLKEPFYVDVDLTFSEAYEFPDAKVRQLVGVITSTFRQHLSVHDPTDLLCLVSMKRERVEKRGDVFHQGVHFHFPFVRLVSLDRRVLYDRVLKEVKREDLFAGVPLAEERLDQILDHRVVWKNPILKFGCNKPGKRRYLLQYQVVPEGGKEVAFERDELENALSIRSSRWVKMVREVEPIRVVSFEKMKEELENRSLLKVTTRRPRAATASSSEVDRETAERVRELVGMLSKERSVDRDSWIQVGLCLHNISDSDEFMELWKGFSLQCPTKAGLTDFKGLWRNFRSKDDGLKVGSLTMWARHDSPERFEAFKLREIDRRISRTIEGNASFDIAKVLREMYDGVYVCGSIKHKTWYQFRGHHYVEIQEGYTLFINISEELVREYQKKSLFLHQEEVRVEGQKVEQSAGDDAVLDMRITELKQKRAVIDKLIDKLKDAAFKGKVMTEARNLFYDEVFESRLNESRNLLVFENGVYDLDRLEFRNGRPEDYMSFTTRTTYSEYSEDDPDVQKVKHVVSEIHRDPQDRAFFLTTLAAALHGRKKEQKLDIWTGSGSNGKSIMIDFLSKALGDFYDSPSITMMTRKRGSSANASPDLAKLKGKRVASFLEPEYDDTLHTSIMKQFFGNDWIEARALYKDPVRFKPQFSGFLACNDLPSIPSTDGGTWRRLRVLEFTTKFVLDPDPDKPEQRPMDPSLPEQIDHLAEAFMAILIRTYEDYQRGGSVVREPPSVTAFTAKYQEENNVYLQYIGDHLQHSPGSRLHFTEAWELFKVWFKDALPNAKVPKKSEFRKNIEVYLGPLPRTGWADRSIK